MHATKMRGPSFQTKNGFRISVSVSRLRFSFLFVSLFIEIQMFDYILFSEFLSFPYVYIYIYISFLVHFSVLLGLSPDELKHR